MNRVVTRWWALALAVMLAAGFVRLGIWQLERAVEKEQILEDFERAVDGAPIELLAWQPMERFRPVRIAGRLRARPVILLDNQVRDGRVGLYLLQVLDADGGGPSVLVNRGWLALTADGGLPDIPARSGALELSGLLADPQRPGIRLGDVNLVDQPQPQRVPWIDIDDLESLLNSTLAPQILLSTEPLDDGLVRAWSPRMMPADKHRAYAVQWFLLAATVIILWQVVSHRNRELTDDQE